MWLSANNKSSYVTTIANDPNVPAGYTLQNSSDGGPDQAYQTNVAGVNSGGFPTYTGDSTQSGKNPNGVLTSNSN